MPFQVVADSNVNNENANPIPAEPLPNQMFHWWICAPGPKFYGCMVRVTAVMDKDHIVVDFIDQNKMVLAGNVEIDLSDRPNVWGDRPSTIQSAKNVITTNTYGLLFLSPEWLKSRVAAVFAFVNNPDNSSFYAKYPFGADGPLSELFKVVDMITTLEKAGHLKASQKAIKDLTDALHKASINLNFK